MKRLLLGLSLAALGACASASARTPVERQPLQVPPPPPRVVQPAVPAEPTPAPEPVADLPAPPTPNRPSRPAPREAPKEAPKPETPKEQTPPETQPANPPQPQPGAPQLRTPQTADDNASAQNVKNLLDHATTTLNGVNYGPLSNERKAQYDTAKRFIQQAQDAIKIGNYVFAQSLAEKADTIAKELAGKY